MSEWQPIETARKDRKAILVWCPENKCQYMVTWCDDDEGWLLFGSLTKVTRRLTHWRELPSSPEVDPEPQQPLRWVENCVPDKPGIWLLLLRDGRVVAETWRFDGKELVKVADLFCVPDPPTRCYLGPIPEILPPKKKVVERLWLEAMANGIEPQTVLYRMHWCVDDNSKAYPINWIRTDNTREGER